ncbi:MAG: AraC family transcriptional regulator ligand-binding domain-containing protein [Pseudoramibacter sp.]
MNHFLVDGQYKTLLSRAGMDPAAVLRQAGLPEDILNHKTVTMTEDQYYRFMTAIGESAGDGMIALATGNQIEAFSPPIFAAWCSPNGRVCIDRLAAYKKLIGPMTWNVAEDEDQVTVTMAPGDPKLTIPSFLAQSDFAFLIGMLRRASQTEIRPVSMTLTEMPADHTLADFAGIEPAAGKPTPSRFEKQISSSLL